MMFRLLFLLALLFALPLHAQSPDRELGGVTRAPEDASATGKRVALLMGVWDYAHVGRLVAPESDIAAMSSVLGSAGWEVHRLPNPQTRAEIEEAVTAVAKSAGPGSTVMVYYAGHAAQQDNTNHLFPAGTRGGNCYTYESETVRVGWILAELHQHKVKAKVLVLDACRNNPFPACDRSVDSLIGDESYTPDGTLIAFSTRKNSTATDGQGGSSPYTAALTRHLATPGLDLAVALALTARDTKAATGGKQEPWFRSGLDGSMVVMPSRTIGDPEVIERESGLLVVTVESGQGDVLIDGVLSWSAAQEFDARRVSVNPGTHRVRVGDEEQVVKIRPGATLSVEFRGEDTAASNTAEGLYEMVRITPGRFKMGSNDGDYDEKPVHPVEISRSYLLGETEVTQRLWQDVMDSNPSHFSSCEDCPVEQVSWLDAARFANALSKQEGLERCYKISGDRVRWPKGLDCEGYRLPTEAEWEYAARAGKSTTYSGSNVLGSVAWTDENSSSKTHPVGLKQPNAWGLYDMSGNVWEWCWDWYGDYPWGTSTDPLGPDAGSDRVERGGSWSLNPRFARVANRGVYPPSSAGRALGLRLARSL